MDGRMDEWLPCWPDGCICGWMAMLPELATDIEHRMQENGIVAQTSYGGLPDD